MSSLLESLQASGDHLIVPDSERFHRDYSIFAATPSAIVRPRTVTELRSVLRIAHDHSVPVIPRGGGSNTSGSAIGTGMIVLMDHEEFAPLSVDPENMVARVGPAVRHDLLQRRLRDHRLWLPSDPSSGPLSLLGGNIATRASGPHALRHGSIARYLREIDLVLPNGDLLSSAEVDSLPGGLRKGLQELADDIIGDEVVFQEFQRRSDQKWASGYDLQALVEHRDAPHRALPRLLCGSVGTLGVVTRAEITAAPVPRDRVVTRLSFRDESDACRAAVTLRASADAVEFLSSETLRFLHSRNSSGADFDAECAALLIVEYSDAVGRDAPGRMESLFETFDLVRPPQYATEPEEIETIWKERKALLPAIRRICRSDGLVSPSLINDVGVMPERLPELLKQLRAIFERRSVRVAIYGHAGSGNLHLRPLLKNPTHDSLFTLAKEVYTCVTDLGGYVTAEHGMGPLRAPFAPLEWSARALEYMERLKLLFDPDRIMNPRAMHFGPIPTDDWSLPVSV